ncbi:uncharacterized protein LOC118436858 [Folsomia candida]|uniref:uncharacterized protein LOC118436858 n=1 Tax=Folsomia candida TaxID=158441 RepID=UPI001604CECE|nr:uncharacterized protein LOC118436858 [Folsomia candida]
MDGTTHLIFSLPEIIHKIMEFLPTPDLELISLNPTWEKEALRHILDRNPIDVHLHHVTDSMDLVPFVNQSPKQLNVIVSAAKENLQMLFSKIELFTTINFNTVTKLSLKIPLDNSLRHLSSRSIKIYESCKNLSSIEVHLIFSEYNAIYSSDQNWTDLLPDSPHVPQKLTTLTVNMSKLYPDGHVGGWSHVVSLTTRILTVFSHVQSLKMIDTPGGLTQKADLILPYLTSISLVTTYHARQEYRFITFETPLNPNFANVTRLEFNLELSVSVQMCEIFNHLAPQLEHLCISMVFNLDANIDFYDSRWITIPILPRLKVFEILRLRGLFCSKETDWFRPYLCLNFETEQENVKLVYEKQFPVLERLIVRLVSEPVPRKFRYTVHIPDENLHFEATILLLHESFMTEGVSPCGTLRNLDISFPTGEFDVGSMTMKRRCWGDNVFMRWGWTEKVPDFYSRIATIFPNVDYHVVERGKQDVRRAKFNKFKEMAVTSGIFDEEGIVT